MLADRNDDFAAAIDYDAGAGPLEAWTNSNLDNGNGKQRSEKENHRSHVIPRQVNVPARLPSADAVKLISREHYKNVF
jgi:hypothetical protein